MKRLTIFKILGLSLVVAFSLSFFSVFILRKINEMATQTFRQRNLNSFALEIEQAQTPEDAINHPPRPGRRESHQQFWIFSETGRILSSAEGNSETPSWEDLPHPDQAHEIALHYHLLGLFPEYSVIRLQTAPATFLTEKTGPTKNRELQLLAPLGLIFVMIAMSVFLALSITFYYLQRKSLEAKTVLARLEKGDLGARFKIDNFDKAGHLADDFNRMADELERLVHRLHETEKARRSMLQELSHDLRTPLTALQTSVETLRDHSDKMTELHRREILELVQKEVNYFNRLVDDLFFMAALDEPHYQPSVKKTDLLEIFHSEITSREKRPHSRILWELHAENSERAIELAGDPLLIDRLVRNGLDNASRYARSKVIVRLSSSGAYWKIQIEDDGPGIKDSDIENFGKRRTQRLELRSENSDGLRISLGLGSVIMRSIIDLHRGKMTISNLAATGKYGTILEFLLPRTTP